MSMKPFGLVRLTEPSKVYDDAMAVLSEIDAIRKESDLERMREFYIDYLFSDSYRLWNYGIKEWLWPSVSKDDLTNEKIQEMLDKFPTCNLSWRSTKRYCQYKMAQRIAMLSETAIKNNSDLFLSEEHLEALRNPDYWNNEL